MIFLDVNILVYAYRTDSPNHQSYLGWLQTNINSDQAFAISDLVFSGYLRVVTHPRVFTPPSPIEHALTFVDELRSRPNFMSLNPGPRHWGIFQRLCKLSGAKGNLVPDAYLAAIAIESGSKWITTDRDFSRFPGLDWRHPLDPNP